MRKMKSAKKTMVYLEATAHTAIKNSGLPMAEFIRQAVDEKLKRQQKRKVVRK